MKNTMKLINGLRNWFGTLAFLSLLVAGLAYGAIWIERVGLEKDAVAAAGKAAHTVLQPALTRDDLDGTMSAARYAELRTLVRRNVLQPPVASVEVWNRDGTAVFADRAGRVGERDSVVEAAFHDALAGSTTRVEGDTLRILVGIDVEGGGDAVVETDRSNADLIEQARDRWDPWVARALRAAVILLALYVVAVGLSLVLRRQRVHATEQRPQSIVKKSAKSRPKNAPKPAASTTASTAPSGQKHTVSRRRRDDAAAPPAYTQPGFRENLEARREAEDALISTKQALDASELERDRLRHRLTKTEGELQAAKRRLGELDATPR